MPPGFAPLAGLGRLMDDFHAQRVSGNLRQVSSADRPPDRGRRPNDSMPLYVSGMLAVVALGLVLVRLRQRRQPDELGAAGRGAN